MFGCFCILMAAFAWMFIPETKGLSLEKMDELFGASKPGEAKEPSSDGELGRPRSFREVTAEKQ